MWSEKIVADWARVYEKSLLYFRSINITNEINNNVSIRNVTAKLIVSTDGRSDLQVHD